MKPTSRKTFISRIFPFLFFLLPFTFYLFPLFLLIGCERNFSPYRQGGIRLTAEYAAVTEAWLRVQVDRLPSDGIITLLRDDSLVYRGALHLRDTTLLDTGLTPNAAYRYRAVLWRAGRQVGLSPPITVTTMDTTSHDFVWEVIEFPSPFGSGALYDVAIINENNIWAVGEIYSDSAQPAFRYNAVHWNGEKWELRRITVEFRNSLITPPGEGVFAFSEDNIWVSFSGAPAHWNGNSWKLYHLWDMGVLGSDDGGVTKIWGSSPDNLYFVGRGGTIVHYNGESWQRIESGTELPIQDIWGAWDKKHSRWEIFTLASDKYLNQGKRLLQIEDTRVISLPDSGLSWSLSSLWFTPSIIYYIAGAGIYPKRKKDWNKPWQRYPSGAVTRYFTNRIRGNNINNVFAVGAFGEVVHFNGVNWRNYYEETQLNIGTYYGLDIIDNLVVAVGQLNGSGVILTGTR